MSYLNHTQLRLEIGSTTADFKYLQITRTINHHTRIAFQISVPPGKQGEYTQHRLLTQPVKVIHTSSQGDDILCQGVITDCNLEKNRDEYTLSATALSFSYYLDIIPRSRSFQDIDQTWQGFFRRLLTIDEQTVQERLTASQDGLRQALLAAYRRTYFIDYAIDPYGATPKQKFDIQLQETDWDMLRRKCSEHKTGILIDDTKDSPQIIIGQPDDLPEQPLPDDNYVMHRNLLNVKQDAANTMTDLPEDDRTSYTVVSDKLLSIGQPVRFLDHSLYVVASESTLDQAGALTHQYMLTSQDGLKISPCYNPLLTGRSLDGRVLAVERDKIKVHISVDRDQDLATAYWMPYSTMYSSGQSSGWYVMPEKNDQVRVHFPSEKEAECVAISSVSKQTPQPQAGAPQQAAGGGGDPLAMNRDRMEDPSIKSFMTKYGKEIILHPDCIRIQGKGVSIVLDDNGGIEINTDKSVHMNAKENLLFSARNIVVQGHDKVLISGGESSVTLTPDKCTVAGPKVKIN